MIIDPTLLMKIMPHAAGLAGKVTGKEKEAKMLLAGLQIGKILDTFKSPKLGTETTETAKQDDSGANTLAIGTSIFDSDIQEARDGDANWVMPGGWPITVGYPEILDWSKR